LVAASNPDGIQSPPSGGPSISYWSDPSDSKTCHRFVLGKHDGAGVNVVVSASGAPGDVVAAGASAIVATWELRRTDGSKIGREERRIEEMGSRRLNGP
jgi:hypothetical protein